jgi:hypothetical protein
MEGYPTDDEEETIETNINDLLNLSIYTLPTLRINAKATEETWQRSLFVSIQVDRPY